MACYDWKLHSKPSTTIQLHVYVVKSDLILVKILKFLDFKKITLAFLVHNIWSVPGKRFEFEHFEVNT